jgi:hypothetical protein
MELVLVLAVFGLFELAALWGADTRDADDWSTHRPA